MEEGPDATLSLIVLLLIVGLELPTQEIPAPYSAEFPLTVLSVIDGLELDLHEIPPPVSAEFPLTVLPLIEGLARAGKLAEAIRLSTESLDWNPEYRTMVCNLWGDVKSSSSGGNQDMIDGVLREFNCEA